MAELAGRSSGVLDGMQLGTGESRGELSRRRLLQLLGASMSLGGLTACRRPVETIVPFVDPPEDALLGEPKVYATTLARGLGAEGVLVQSHDGRPTKIEGNPLHSSSLGAASVWSQASILDLYDPDRSRFPLRRSSAGLVERASWEGFAAFWKELAVGYQGSQGEGLGLLVEPFASPTQARLLDRFSELYRQARVAIESPLGDESSLAALALLYGTPARPMLHLERARVVVALDADLLYGEDEAVRNAHGLASARSPDGAGCRLYVAESAWTVTGATADHRWRVKRSEIPWVVAALAAELADLGLPLPLHPGPSGLSDLARARVRRLAAALAVAGSAAVVVVGRSQPAEVQALAWAIDAALGAFGTTVTLHPARDARWRGGLDFAELVSAAAAGDLETLVVLGGNPAYTAPGELQIRESFGRVRHLVHLSSHIDETAQLASWHLPLSHSLESWGDRRAADGTASIVQPLIAPLFESRDPIELLALLTDSDAGSSYDEVRRTWLGELVGGSENEWLRALHDGVLADSGEDLEPLELSADRVLELQRWAASYDPGEGLELTLHPSAALLDGRLANNGWLQELPDPITKLTWGNAALVSPRTASALGVEDGDEVRLELDSSVLELPALVLPGQVDDSVAVVLGYGRTAAGGVGNGVGADAFLLRRRHAPWGARGLGLRPTGRRRTLANTQDHWRPEASSPVVEASAGEVRQPTYRAERHQGVAELVRRPEIAEGPQWGMVIDLAACIGCNACVVACQAENNVPIVGAEQVARGREMHWLRVDRYFSGEPEDPRLVVQPVPCMQCENAPCEEVCPVGATVHDHNGLNAMVYNRCVGTRYCSNNCAYKVRRFNYFNLTRELPELLQLAMNPDVTVRSRGVMEKCTFCVQRLHRTERDAKRDGRALADGEARTACQQTCPTRAITFGDLANPESAVAGLQSDRRRYRLLAALGTEPRVSYLARVHDPDPEWPA